MGIGGFKGTEGTRLVSKTPAPSKKYGSVTERDTSETIFKCNAVMINAMIELGWSHNDLATSSLKAAISTFP